MGSGAHSRRLPADGSIPAGRSAGRRRCPGPPVGSGAGSSAEAGGGGGRRRQPEPGGGRRRAQLSSGAGPGPAPHARPTARPGPRVSAQGPEHPCGSPPARPTLKFIPFLPPCPGRRQPWAAGGRARPPAGFSAAPGGHSAPAGGPAPSPRPSPATFWVLLRHPWQRACALPHRRAGEKELTGEINPFPERARECPALGALLGGRRAVGTAGRAGAPGAAAPRTAGSAPGSARGSGLLHLSRRCVSRGAPRGRMALLRAVCAATSAWCSGWQINDPFCEMVVSSSLCRRDFISFFN